MFLEYSAQHSSNWRRGSRWLRMPTLGLAGDQGSGAASVLVNQAQMSHWLHRIPELAGYCISPCIRRPPLFQPKIKKSIIKQSTFLYTVVNTFLFTVVITGSAGNVYIHVLYYIMQHITLFSLCCITALFFISFNFFNFNFLCITAVF